jgi:hypothetical protein
MLANGSDPFTVWSFAVSVFALAISALTAWLTLFRRGALKMTRPTQIFFGYDNSRENDERPWPKVFLRALLLATARRGLVIENLYVKLTCEDIAQTFDIWVYGQKHELVRGSGLFISDTGVEASHHFLASTDDEPFHFIAGIYRLEVHATVLGQSESRLLFSDNFEVSIEESDSIGERGSGLYFDWSSEERLYSHHIKQAPRSFWED